MLQNIEKDSKANHATVFFFGIPLQREITPEINNKTGLIGWRGSKVV